MGNYAPGLKSGIYTHSLLFIKIFPTSLTVACGHKKEALISLFFGRDSRKLKLLVVI
jgi:hypothetical protein